MADVTERIEKQMEGTNLALAAVAEVLQKMDARFSVDEESQIRKAEAKEAASERLTLVKEIASEVVGFLKADQGLDVDGLKTRSAAKVKGTGDDNEKPANVKSNIADQQATIQAMRKQDEEEEEEEEAPFPPKGGYMKNVEEDEEEEVEKGEDDEEDDEDLDKEGSEEYPAEEEEPEEDELKSMAKELRKMKKQMRLQKATMEKTIQTEAESRLRKMGFREENSLQRPQILGVDGSTPIVKKESGETVDQLMNLSYKQLRDLQAQIEMGNTDGVPKELIGGN